MFQLVKKSFLLILMCCADCYGFRPQPGYWYNNTNAKIKVKEAGTSSGVSVDPHALLKMDDFRYLQGRNPRLYAQFHYAKEGGKTAALDINESLVGDLGKEYVIVFKDNSSSDTGLAYSAISKKAFDALEQQVSQQVYESGQPKVLADVISGYVGKDIEPSKKEEVESQSKEEEELFPRRTKYIKRPVQNEQTEPK